jgi:hypothetical protein
VDRRNPNYFDELKAATARILKSRDGELLMDFLKEQYLLCRFKDETLARQTGRRDVVLTLMDLVENDRGSTSNRNK